MRGERTYCDESLRIEVVCIPTNRALTRVDSDDLVYKTVRAKFNAVADEIELMRKAGRPVLVGTTSVILSEQLSRMLSMRNCNRTCMTCFRHYLRFLRVLFCI